MMTTNEDSAAIREGMPVYGSDGQPIGPVVGLAGDEITPIILIAGGYSVPANAIERVEGGRVWLPSPAAMYLSQLRADDGPAAGLDLDH